MRRFRGLCGSSDLEEEWSLGSGYTRGATQRGRAGGLVTVSVFSTLNFDTLIDLDLTI